MITSLKEQVPKDNTTKPTTEPCGTPVEGLYRADVESADIRVPPDKNQNN